MIYDFQAELHGPEVEVYIAVRNCSIYKFGFSKDIITSNELLTKSGSSLFLKMQSSVHCLNYLLPPKKITSYKLRNSDCSYVLPQCNSSVFKHSFINWCLFKL